jgi:hypothetical protein
MKKKSKRFLKKEKQLMKQNLELVRKFLLEVINNPYSFRSNDYIISYKSINGDTISGPYRKLS